MNLMKEIRMNITFTKSFFIIKFKSLKGIFEYFVEFDLFCLLTIKMTYASRKESRNALGILAINLLMYLSLQVLNKQAVTEVSNFSSNLIWFSKKPRLKKMCLKKYKN